MRLAHDLAGRTALRAARPAFALALAIAAGGCGYGWQGTRNPWEASGVRTVFLDALVNNTLKPGVEVPFASALAREFARGGRFRVVDDRGDADAVVGGTVDLVSSGINSSATVPQITQDPEAKKHLSDMVIASDYVLNAGMTVQLVRQKDGKALWTQAFRQSKVYPGNNRFGLPGTTSALINASQERIALAELVQTLANDVHDTILEAF